jgi:hypothetical protein
MILSENNLRNAINKLILKLDIPRPINWIREQDKIYKKKFIQSYIESLKEIDNVSMVYGFDINNV